MAAIDGRRARSLIGSVPTALAALAVMSLAAAGIHFAVMGEHFTEYAPFGFFFSVVAWLQALWAMAIVAAPSRLLLVGALIGNAIVVVVWIVSRTVGLPLGPEAWAVEPASFLDVLSTFLEIGIVAGVATVLSRPSLARDVGRGGVAVGALALLLIALTTAGVASGGEGHGEEGGHDEHVSTDATGLARADLGAGRELQVLVDEGEQLSLMHLTFFNDEGTALDVTSALVLATPTEGGDAIQVPTQEFEPGHYVTTLDLEPGEWTFEVSGNAGEGGDFDTTFNSTLG